MKYIQIHCSRESQNIRNISGYFKIWIFKKNDPINKNSLILLGRPDAGLIRTLSLRRAGLSQTLHSVHFSSYFCTLSQNTTDGYQCASVQVFLMIIQCKLNRKPSASYVFRDYAFGSKIVTSHRVRVNSGNSGSFK